MAAGIARSVGFVILFVIAAWGIGELVGFEISLMSTLIGSVILTVIANLAFSGFQRLTT